MFRLNDVKTSIITYVHVAFDSVLHMYDIVYLDKKIRR